MNYLLQRQHDLLRSYKTAAIDSMLITNPVNVRYLTGFTGDSSYFWLSPKQSLMISDARYEQQLREECPDQAIHIRPHDRTMPEIVGEVLPKLGARSVGIEADHVTLALREQLAEYAPKLTLVPLLSPVTLSRAVKDPSEVEQIREAIRLAERAFRMFVVLMNESDTERELVDALEGYLRKTGAKASAFPPIVAVGTRGALPHATPTARKLGQASKVLIDWGADIGYKSDLTRTIRSPFGTNPTRRNKQERTGYDLEELHDLVLKAQEAAAAAARPGVPAHDVDAAARKVIADAGYGDFFIHGTGHGIGLEVHELPRIRSRSPDQLQAGMVVTLEPGIYIPEWGGVRIEDDFLITNEGAIRLSTLPREPVLLG